MSRAYATQVWTPARVTVLLQMKERRHSFAQIGDRLGVSANAAKGKWYALQLADAAAAGTVERACLRCRRRFASEGAHNRVCGPCKLLPSWGAGISEVVVMVPR